MSKKRSKITIGSNCILLDWDQQNACISYAWNEKRHCNAAYELHVILEGSCMFEDDGSPGRLEQGDAVLITPGVHHMAGENTSSFRRFSFQFSFVQGELKTAMERLSGSCRFYADRRLIELCILTGKESGRQDELGAAALQGLLTATFVCMLRNLPVRTPSSAETEKRSMIQTDIIDEFFEKNHPFPAYETDLAKQLGVSSRQLVRILKQEYGMCFREKLIKARLDHAAWLLRESTMTVSKISEQVGFCSESNFYKKFQSFYHESPKHYRNRLRFAAGNK